MEEMLMQERNTDRSTSVRAPTWDRTHNPGTCPEPVIEPATPRLAERCPTNAATLAGAHKTLSRPLPTSDYSGSKCSFKSHQVIFLSRATFQTQT